MGIPPIYRNHESFIEATEKFLDDHIAPKIDEWEKQGRFPDDAFSLLGANGYLGLLISEEFGGIGGDLSLAGAWCEVFGKLPALGFVTGVNMHSLVISKAVERFGSKSAKEKWLRKAVSGELIGAYAFSEPGAGSDLARIRTTAKRVGSSWVLNGAKTFITNGARAHFIIVLAKTDVDAGYKGFTSFLVDTSLAGFSVQKTLDKYGWHSSDTAELLFDNVELSDDDVLGQPGEGWAQANANLNWERMMLTLTSLAGARECLRISEKYASERQAFGSPLTSLVSVQSYLKEMATRIDVGEALSHETLGKMINGEDARLLVSLAKRIVCDDACWIADKALQIHGGYGYTTEFKPERWLRDLRLMPIGGGTSEVMASIVVKELMKELKV